MGGDGAYGHLAVGELAAGFVGQLDDQLEVGREIDGAGAHARSPLAHDQRLPQQKATAPVLVVQLRVVHVLVEAPEAREDGGRQLAAHRAR